MKSKAIEQAENMISGIYGYVSGRLGDSIEKIAREIDDAFIESKDDIPSGEDVIKYCNWLNIKEENNKKRISTIKIQISEYESKPDYVLKKEHYKKLRESGTENIKQLEERLNEIAYWKSIADVYLGCIHLEETDPEARENNMKKLREYADKLREN